MDTEKNSQVASAEGLPCPECHNLPGHSYDCPAKEGLRAAAQEVVDAWDAAVVNLDVEPAIEALRSTPRTETGDVETP